jgi:putative MFS transporter
VIEAWREARSHLDRQHWFLLIVLGTTTFFEGFDRAIVELALPQIRSSFGLSQASASLWLTALFLGALPAIALTRRADRVGRRRMLIWSVAGYTLATGATAMAPNIATFAACQFVARLFLNAEAAIVWTMAAEELPAKARGYGFGLLGMTEALGVGFGAILYGGIFEPNGVSWRWLYVVGLPPLLFVAWMRRRLPESGRFTAARDEGRLAPRWQAILQPPHRKWLVLIVAAAFLTQLLTQASVFAIDYLQTDRHLSATASNLMLIFAGLPGIPLMVLAGSLSDRHGRRLVGCLFGSFSVIGALAFFWIPGGIPVLLPSMSLVLVGSMAATPVLGTYAAELFPTALRGQAGSWVVVAKLSGQAASLAIGAGLVALTGGLPWAVTFLAVGPALGIVLFAVAFPDTHGRELEDIAPDEVAPVVLPL